MQCARKTSFISIDYYLLNYNTEENLLYAKEIMNLKGHVKKLSQKSYSYYDNHGVLKDSLQIMKSTLTYDLEFNTIGEITKMWSSLNNSEKHFLSFKKGLIESETKFNRENDTISHSLLRYDGQLLKEKITMNNGSKNISTSEINVVGDTTYVIGEYFEQLYLNDDLIRSNIGQGINNYTTYKYHSNKILKEKRRFHNGKISTIQSYNSERELIVGATFVYENSNNPTVLDEIRIIFIDHIDLEILGKLQLNYNPKAINIQIRRYSENAVETFRNDMSNNEEKLFYKSSMDENGNITKTVNHENGIETSYTYDFDKFENWVRKETVVKGKTTDVLIRKLDYYNE